MKQEDKELQQLYIMNIKTLEISKVNVNKVDECKFANFVFNEYECCFDLRGANIQTLAQSFKCSDPRYIVSKDIGSLNWMKTSIQWLVDDIGFTLRSAWNNIYDEKF